MTIAEVLRKVDMIKPNRFTAEQKIGWLDDIERQIWFDIICTHENPRGIRRTEYDINSDPDTQLIAPPPYDEVYVLYLQCQIDLGNMEISKYNNSQVLFNNALLSFRDYWNRTFMPCNRAQCFVFDDRKRGPRMPYDGRPLYSMGNPLDIDEKKRPPMAPAKPGPVKPSMPMPKKRIEEQLVEIRATDVNQQRDIEQLKKKPEAQAMSDQEVGDILV